MEQNFEIEKTNEGIELRRENVEGLGIRCIEGLCVADSNNLARPRDKQWYIKNITGPLLDNGKISDGSGGGYDDRKFRFHSASIRENVLEISFGASYYQEFIKPHRRSVKENLTFQKLGVEKFRERWAFFPRCPGVCALPITEDGSVFVGKNMNRNLYYGNLGAVTGHLDYNEKLQDVDLEENIIRELREELGISSNELESLTFVGSFADKVIGSIDFGYLVRVKKGDKYFLDGHWRKKASDIEHGNFVRLANYMDVQQLLKEGKLSGDEKEREIIPSARGVLMSIRKNEMSS